MPGPGQYSDKTSLGQGPKTVLTSRKFADYSKNVPGPGAHDISFKLIEKHSGSAILKNGRNEEPLNLSPGPGKYDVKFERFKTSYSF